MFFRFLRRGPKSKKKSIFSITEFFYFFWCLHRGPKSKKKSIFSKVPGENPAKIRKWAIENSGDPKVKKNQ